MDSGSMEVLYDGKTKRLVRSGDRLFLKFKDTLLGNAEGRVDPGGDFVVGESVGKGKAAASVAARIFERLNGEGQETHFVGKKSDDELEILKADRIRLEVIYRALAYGSFLRRYKGFVKPLAELDLVEFTLKDDALGDPLIVCPSITKLGIATREEVEEMRKMAVETGKAVGRIVDEVGFRLVDLKVEFGRRGGKLIVIDAIHGDTMRALEKKSGKVPDPVELDRKLAEVLR